MEPKNSKIFSKEILQAVSAFCESEDIKDIDKFMYLCFKQGFDIKRYGLLGETLNEGEKNLETSVVEEKQVIKEVIVEKRVEIPIEIIKEVEKIVEVIKEVPVEKVIIKETIKEVPVDRVVEKEIYITDDNQVNELGEKIAKLEEEKQIFSTKMEEMENIFQNKMSKKDEELDELRHNLDIIKENDKTKLLQDTLQNLRSELQNKNQQIKELEKINRDLLNGNQNQAYLLRGSNLKDRL